MSVKAIELVNAGPTVKICCSQIRKGLVEGFLNASMVRAPNLAGDLPKSSPWNEVG